MNDKIVQLLPQEDMLERLAKIDNDSHLQEKFYPLLLKHSGEEKTAAGIVLLVSLAIYDYSQGMPPFISSTLFGKADRFVEALIDDMDTANSAKNILKNALDDI